ncbi:PLP-dependent aminotransferase family protein [Microlunatus speluncae]|uniref:aminotransferase-like domain-containing protein n=1 Tax=Microlunatus speluncae TaxID=2594267 RepID=UPI0012665B91|nr:PLP-dependent aminotransferase family protein [Microlunatus speluncae]
MTTRVQPLPALSERFATVKPSVVRELLALTQRPGVISFAGGLPAPEFFDLEGALAAVQEVLTSPSVLQYSPTEGNAELRARIAERYASLGLATDPEQIVITTGSQQGISLLASTLVDPGDVVLVERPSYLAALQCFTLAGAQLIGVPGSVEAVDLEALADLAERHRPKAFYTVPNFHNPTGRTLPPENRAGIVELADRYGFRVIEDDPYRELSYGSPAPPSLAIGAEPGRVVSTGSFSKILAPGLRLGWIRTDPSIKPAVVIAKQAADLHTSTLDQAAAARYLASGRLDQAVERSRAGYAERRDAMLAALPEALPEGSSWNRPAGGMFIWATLPEGTDTAGLLGAAIDHDVAFVPGAPFFPGDAPANTMRLSFVTYPPEQIAEGARRLGEVLRRRT